MQGEAQARRLQVALGPGSASFAPASKTRQALRRVAVQVGALVAQPLLGFLDAGARAPATSFQKRGPWFISTQMRHLVGRDIVEHVRRAPGSAARRRTAARWPSTSPSAWSGRAGDVTSPHAELAGVPADALVEIVARLPTSQSFSRRGACSKRPPRGGAVAVRRVSTCTTAPCARPDEADAVQAPRSGMLAPSANGTGSGHAAEALAHPVEVALEKPVGLVHAAPGGHRDDHRPPVLLTLSVRRRAARVAPHLDRRADALDLERDSPRPLLALHFF